MAKRAVRSRERPRHNAKWIIPKRQWASLPKLAQFYTDASGKHKSCKSEATPTHPSQRETWRPDLKRLPWLVTCLSSTGQGELLATQNPDGSLVLSAVLKDEQGLLSFLLVPPSPKRTPHGHRHAGKSFPALESRRPVGRRLHSNPDGDREMLSGA